MARIGVGVGDEFPIEEETPRGAGDSGAEDQDETCRRSRGREHRRAWHGRHPDWHSPSARRIWPALIVIGGVALLIAIISQFFYFFLGAAVLAILFFMYRNHHDAMWDMHPNPPSSSDKK